MNKYCRICWNTGSWRGPTGEAAKLETGDSYVRQRGFGHEEWLFNFSWLQPGPKGTSGKCRYARLQPIAKYQGKYEKQTFNVFLYTVTPDKSRMAVAIIKDVFVPPPEELEEAYEYMRARDWLTEMEDDLSSLGISTKELRRRARNTINVRFSRAAVKFF
jgi:hypothetical protein